MNFYFSVVLKAPLIILFCLASSILSNIFAQETSSFSSPAYSLAHYTAENGLPQNSVKSITPDELGFLWLATEDGLARFDGNKFVVFNKSNTRISSNRFFQSFKGFHDGKLYFFGENNSILRIKGGQAVPDWQYSAFFKKTNTIFSEVFTSVYHNYELTGRPNYDYAWQKAILVTKPGTFFLCDSNRVRHFEQQKLVSQTLFENKKLVNYFTMKERLFHLDKESGVITQIGKSTIEEISLTGDILHHPLFKAGQKKDIEVMWNVFSSHQMLYYHDHLYSLELSSNKTLSTTLLFEGFNMKEHLITSCYYDKPNERVFLGSSSQGLFVFSKKQFSAFRGSEGRPYYEQHLYDKKYIIADRDGAFNIQGTAMQKMPMGVRFNHLPLFIANNGEVWPRDGRMLSRYSHDGKTLLGKWDIYWVISSVYDAPGRFLWIGYEDGSLRRIDPDKPGLTYIRIPGLNTRINYMIQQPATGEQPEYLWIASGSGLFRLNLANLKTASISGLDSMNIRSLLLRPGTSPSQPYELWGTTYEDGFFLYRNGHITKFPIDNHGFLSASHCITEDKNGFFWIPTNKGLFQVSRNDLLAYADRRQTAPYYLYYNRQNGFLSDEFNGGCQPCSLRLPNGLVSLPSINGLVKFAPEKIKPYLPNKALLVDQIEYNGKKIPFSDTLTLPDDFEYLKFHVTTPYFGNPRNIQIKYHLASRGVRASWFDVAQNGEITFNRLPGDDYQLVIRKSSGFGSNNYSEKRITIIVPKKWYQTAWFSFFAFLFFLSAVYLYVKWRTANIKRRNEQLERFVAQRTATLQDSQSELSRQLHIQERMMASITHDVKAPLKSILATAGNIRELNERKNYDMTSRIGESIQETAAQMLTFLENLLQYVRSTVYEKQIKKEEFDLHDMVNSKIKLFENTSRLHENQVYNHIPVGFKIESNPQLLSVIAHNLMDNAIKYCYQGQILINQQVIDDHLHVIISDNGKGVSQDILLWFNDPASEITMAHSDEHAGSRGFGLMIVKEIAKLIGLEVFVENNNGAHFHLVLNLNL